MGIVLMPWQEIGGRYLTALGPDGLPLYREVCIVVARQCGKTTLMKPFIIAALRAGKKIMHIAQTRELPREMFRVIAAELEEDLFLQQRGRGGKMHTMWPRFGAGQEEILLKNGGEYRIAAANSGGARGRTNDIVIIDELREMDTFAVMDAAEPTLSGVGAQLIYLSNAGTEASVVLNSARDRAGKMDSLAYLEWSADPDRGVEDIEGWLEANPAWGHKAGHDVAVQQSYERAKLSGTLASFETERLCRWVRTMRPALVTGDQWTACEATGRMPLVRRSHLAVSMDPEGSRASAAVASLGDDGICYLTLLPEVKGSPVRTSLVGKEWRAIVDAKRIAKVGYDSLTDAELAKHFRQTKPIVGNEFANATSNFVRLVESGELRWKDAGAVGDDLTWTARKENDETGSYVAVRANDDRPITAALAAIRAVWMATGVRSAKPRVY